MDKKPSKGGRPKATEPRTAVSTWLPARVHDRLIREANAKRTSVSAHVRELLTQR